MNKFLNIFEDRKKTLIFFIIISLILIGLIVGLIFTVNYFNNKNQIQVEDTEANNQLIEMGVSLEDINKMSEQEKYKLIDEQYYERTSDDYKYQESKKEYEGGEEFYQGLLTKVGQYKFKDIITSVTNLTANYNFTTAINRKIIAINNDASMLTKVYKLNETGIQNVIRNLSSVEVYTAFYFSLPNDLVKSETICQNAKFPYFNGNLLLTEPKELDYESMKKEFFSTYFLDKIDENDRFYKIEVRGQNINGNAIKETCYVTRGYTKELQMLGCFEDETYSMMVSQLN